MLRTILAVPAVLTFLVLSQPAQAALQRVFVSAASGSDANAASGCSIVAPCRGFATAVATVDAGGEVVVLDSGAYGSVTIAKSVSIIAPEGIYGGIAVLSGAGVGIATAGVKVVLRGLTINGMGGLYGINMTDGASLTVENCVITNMATIGLTVATAAQVRILNSRIQGNPYGVSLGSGAKALVSGTRLLDASDTGLIVGGFSAETKVDVVRSEASGSIYGFRVYSGAGQIGSLHIRDSVASRNLGGVVATSAGGTASASVSDSLISSNDSYGVWADGSGAKAISSGNRVMRNGTGLNQSSSAVLESTGDNTVRDNGAASSGTITSVGKL